MAGLLAAGALAVVIVAQYKPPGYFRGDNLWGNPPHDSYDLAFLELTERGNLYHRELLQQLEKDIAGRSDALILVAIHGWQHNAREDDAFVQSFRRLLFGMARSGMIGGRRVLGVYIGWPGRSAPPILSMATYWPRKSVAEEIGKGGVSEILLRIERAARSQQNREVGNVTMFVGHSFGGAIMMSALHEVLLERVIEAEPDEGSCVRTRPFGNGVVLLNPAIEANQVLQLKEFVSEKCFSARQDKLLHVISSASDFTTHNLFPLGQRIRMFGWSEEENLDRSYGGQQVPLSEYELDRTTAGNFEQFWTGRLLEDANGRWRYCAFAAESALACDDLGVMDPKSPIPSVANDPLSFVYSDRGFMADHNDVFNPQVSAYLSAAAIDSMRKHVAPEPLIRSGSAHPCNANVEFGNCFESLSVVFDALFDR